MINYPKMLGTTPVVMVTVLRAGRVLGAGEMTVVLGRHGRHITGKDIPIFTTYCFPLMDGITSCVLSRFRVRRIPVTTDMKICLLQTP